MPTSPTRRTPIWRRRMPSAVASRSSRGGGTASVAVAAASRGPASSRTRCARERPRGCGRARSTSGGGRRRCYAQEEGRAVVRGEFVFIPSLEKCGPRLAVVRVEARVDALLVAHRLDDLVDGGVEGGARWRRRDWGAARTQTPSSGRAEVGRRRVARRVQQPALPLVQGALAESVVGRAVIVQSVARHCSPGGGGGGGEWIGEKLVNVAGQTCGRPRYIGGRTFTRLAAWLAVHRRQLLQRAEEDARGRRRCAEDETMRTMTALSRRQVGATRRAGNFLAVSRAIFSSGVPECVPEGHGWPGLAGWMKGQIRVKTRIREHD
jgi:hypothetical protein